LTYRGFAKRLRIKVQHTSRRRWWRFL